MQRQPSGLNVMAKQFAIANAAIAGGVLLASLIAATASAQEYIIFGEGFGSCGSWTNARQARTVESGLKFQWLAGYLSGLNAAPHATARDPLSGTDAKALMAWIDNYCAANPLDALIIAAGKLMDELRVRAQR
jgi:hypothetical protein